MQLKVEQLSAQLQRGLEPLYTLYGDEPLLALETGDAIRAAARAAGHAERSVHTVAGAHFDWSSLLGEAMAMSLFCEARLIEIRIPSGKPGKDGALALQHYVSRLPEGVVTLVTLPRLDRQQQQSAWFSALDAAGITVRLDPIERHALPQWLAKRLAAQGQRVCAGDEGQRTLAFFADRIEGNLLAAQQELAKLGLLYPAGELTLEQVSEAVLDVARYDIYKLGEAVLSGQVARVLRMLEGLRAEGQTPVLVHWTLSEDIRALLRCKNAMAGGKPLPMALRENRVWGQRERLFERALPLLTQATLERLLQAAQVCDGLVKGLADPAWPSQPWAALQRLALMLAEPLQSRPRAPHPPAPDRLVLHG